MENFENKWAPFPEDDVTTDEHKINIDKLKLLGELKEIQGLHSNSFSERLDALYEFARPMHRIVLASGKDVEVPIVELGKAKKIGRDAAGFCRNVEVDFTLEGQSYTSMTFIATIEGLTISLAKGTPVPEVMLNISLPEGGMSYLFLIGRGLGAEHFLHSSPGGILDPQSLILIEKMLISASRALSSATKI